MQRGVPRASRRARAAANGRTVSMTVRWEETRRMHTISGNRALVPGDYVLSMNSDGSRHVSTPRVPRPMVRDLRMDVPRRDADDNPIRKRDVKGYFDDVPAGTGAMQPGNIMWSYARSKILDYPDAEKHLGIT